MCGAQNSEMEDAKTREVLKAILDAANGWTGRSILVRDLALKLGISHEEAVGWSDELIASGLAWGSMDPSAESTRHNLQICVSPNGRYFLDGFPDPHPEMWMNAPNAE
jgi:hypothetical protein